MKVIEPQSWKSEFPEFREKTNAFYTGNLSKKDYKGFSGRYGSYAQRDGKSSMFRLRMTAGRITKEKLAFAVEQIRKYQIEKLHFTTCQTLQFHNMQPEAIYDIMEGALDHDIISMGGGGDYPRNVMCSPLTGTQPGEYFDVLPYAEAAADYLMTFINAEKMPRKLKVSFSNSIDNITHTTYRDLGFVARADGKFDVYSAGGLGNNAKLGVLVAEGAEADEILYYIKAMWLTFITYGNYTSRAKARTRYMQDALGGPEGYKKAYLEKLAEVKASGEDLTLSLQTNPVTKTGDGSLADGIRILSQKQDGLYTVCWHPQGGQPNADTLCRLNDLIRDMKDVELRISPYETAYIINLTGDEAQKVLSVTETDTAKTLFETSISCIGASICQVGARDSQALLDECIKAVQTAGIPDGALPQIHISGCPSSCGTHQTALIGFRGAAKGGQPAFLLYANGCEHQGHEAMGREIGTILQQDIPVFLVELGNTVAASHQSYTEWIAQNEQGIDAVAAKYI